MNILPSGLGMGTEKVLSAFVTCRWDRVQRLSPVGYLPAVLMVHTQSHPVTEASVRHQPCSLYLLPLPQHVLCHPGEGAVPTSLLRGAVPSLPPSRIPQDKDSTCSSSWAQAQRVGRTGDVEGEHIVPGAAASRLPQAVWGG